MSVPFGEEDRHCEIDYEYKPGSQDYFAGGCWNPGDPSEINVTEMTANDVSVDFETLEASQQELIWAKIDEREESMEQHEWYDEYFNDY